VKPLTVAEAAEFLRLSRSSLYQRKDIPRYRRPGSRVILFDQEELEAWLRQGRISGNGEVDSASSPAIMDPPDHGRRDVVDISQPAVYHRSARYR